MVLGRFKEAVSDAAETLRRVFSSPACHEVPARFSPPGTTAFQALEAVGRSVAYQFESGLVIQELQFQPGLKTEPTSFSLRA
ncbi:MAG TPA: hypothetical protein VN436_01135, partial [Holophaga sp.]|nr:hypothetical protein [Holophaga sp.]